MRHPVLPQLQRGRAAAGHGAQASLTCSPVVNRVNSVNTTYFRTRVLPASTLNGKLTHLSRRCSRSVLVDHGAEAGRAELEGITFGASHTRFGDFRPGASSS
jgi:hypothetical protein